MQRSLLIAILAAAAGCSARDRESEPLAAAPSDIAGTYGQGGQVGSLKLDADGSYECFVFNGLTSDGCATFVGAGVSAGSWAFDDGTISFTPANEPAELVVKLSEVSAVRSADGLVLSIEGKDYFLAKDVAEAERVEEALQPDGAPPGR